MCEARPGPCDDICYSGYVYIPVTDECTYTDCGCRVFETEHECMGYCTENWFDYVKAIQEAFRKLINMAFLNFTAV